MKKVLLTCSGNAFSEGAFHFVRQLNERQPLLLTGVFLPEIVYTNLWSDGGIPLPSYFPIVDPEDEGMHAAMTQFETACQQHNIACRLHQGRTGLPQAEILEETRFADVLIVSSETAYRSFAEGELHPGLHDVLHGAECPVIVVPEQFQFPTRTILLYDGSASSVFAIKQFGYLFPELCDQQTLLVYTKEAGDEHLPQEDNIRELAAQHFKTLEFSRLHLHAKKDLNAWISGQEGVMLVGGAFGRSGLSEAVRKSFMHDLITLRRFPVFVAHR